MKIVITGYILMCCLLAQAQQKTKVKNKTLPDVKIAYQGNANVRGILLGAEKQLLVKHKKCSKKNNTRVNELTIGSNMWFNKHPTLNNNWLINVELIKRSTFNNKWFLEATGGYGKGNGFERSNFASTYVKQTDGSLKKINARTNFSTINLEYGGGLLIKNKRTPPIAVYAKVGVNATYHYTFGLFSVTSEIGFRYRFK